MNKAQIERYFRALAKLYPDKCWVILTGAAAGVLYGRIRATMDIDFSVEAENWQRFSDAVQKVSHETGIAAQYAEDIDRWSSITLMDYRKHTYIYGRFGHIEVHLMEPPYWAIGKFSRYLDSDVQDLIKVFKKTGTNWRDVTSVAGRALRRSPKSTACILFRRQVENFLEKFGSKVWGKRFEKGQAISHFRKSAKIH